MTILVEQGRSFSDRVQYLEGEDKRLSWPGSVNVLFVQNMTSTLDYFKADLSNILKEATLQQICSTGASNSQEQVVVAIEKKYQFDNLNYYALYDVLMSLLNKVSKISNRHDEVVKSLLDTLCFTLVFVDENTRIEIPAKVAGLLYQIDDASAIMKDYFMNSFCKTIIPVSFGIIADKSLRGLDDIPCIIMQVLESVQDVALHFRLIETLMLFKENLWIDIMSVISFSEGISKVYAAQLLFHYWPHLHTSSKQHKLPSSLVYNPIYCENLHCQSIFSMRTATTMVLDASYPAKIAGKPSPLYLCNACTQMSLDNENCLHYVDVVLPIEYVTYYCENKHCLAKESLATVTLLGSKSSIAGGSGKYVSQAEKHNLSWHFHNRTMRYCLECYHNLQHVIGSLNLTTQIAPMSAWSQSNPQYTRVIVDAVICLLTEDIGIDSEINMSADANGQHGVYPCDGCIENVGFQSLPKSLTHFGVWLLVSLCSPQEEIEQELASQLIAAVLVWYRNKSLLSSDDHGSRLETFKSSLLWEWLMSMQNYHFKSFLNCLLPNPSSESRVKGNWDSIRPLLYYYKNGLEFFAILAPYSIISFELWECLMPCWMVALCENLCSEDLKKLERTINILFDEEMFLLGFESRCLFNFILRSFEETELIHHENALEWIQLLCEVNVAIPIATLIEMLFVSSSSMQFYLSTATTAQNHSSDNEGEIEESRKHYRLPSLTERETWEIMHRSQYPGVESLTDVLEAIYTSPSDMHDDSSHDQLHAGSNERRKSLRSGSMRASKRIKAAFLKPKRSLTRRFSPSFSQDEASDHDRPSSPSRLRSPPTPTMRKQKTESQAERKLDSDWKYARVICCYVDILDALLQQLQLQGCDKHEGLDADQSISALDLLCSLFWNILENNEERTMLTDTSSRYVQAELDFIADFCKLAAKLLAFFVPKEVKKEVIIFFSPFVQEKSANLNDWAHFVDPVCLSMDLDLSEDQYLNISNQSVRLLHLLVKILDLYENNRSITNHIIECISLVCINGEMFDVSEVEKMQKELDFRKVISSLWKQLDVRYSDTSRSVVAVLFQIIASIENAWVYQFQLFNAPFYNSQFYSSHDKSIECWNKEYEALDRIHTLLMFLSDYKIEHLQIRSAVSHVATYALAVLLSALGSKHSAVHIKAKFILDSLSAENLQMAYQCLEYEFDSSVKDRTFILSQYLLLHQLRLESSPLSFARFSHVMDVLSSEAKLCTELRAIMQFVQIPRVLDNTRDTIESKASQSRTSNSITFDEWLRMADLISDIDSDFSGRKTGNFTAKDQEFKCENSDLEMEQTSPSKKNDFLDDKYTVDSLMRVMCRYMTECEHNAEQQLSPRSHDFFQYFRNWIGYNERIGVIIKTGAALRNAIGVNTLLKNLPNIMDANINLGNYLLPKLLSFLAMITKISENTSSHPSQIGSTDYDLGILSVADQIAWLKTLQVIMYKYPMKGEVELEQLSHLLNVCLNVLLCEYHSCTTSNLEMDAMSDEKKKSEKTLASVSTKRKTLNKIGKHIVVNVDTSCFNESGDRDLDDASRPLLDCQTSSNRQDFSSLSLDDAASSKESLGVVCSEGCATQNACTGGRRDTNEAIVTEHMHKIRCIKHGDTFENTNNDCLRTATTCKHCKALLKEYDVQVVSLCIANLCQFVRLSRSSAVQLLPQLLSQLALIAEPLCQEQFVESSHSINTPADIVLVAKQAIRCILHQLADSRIFSCIFYIPFPKESSFLRVLIACLRDYHSFHCVGVLQHTLQDLPEDLKLPKKQLYSLLFNMSSYLQYLRNEPIYNTNSNPLSNLFSSFFNKLHGCITKENVTIDIDIVLMLMINFLKAGILTKTVVEEDKSVTVVDTKCVLEPFTKILSTCISNYKFSSELLYELCEVSHDLHQKEKDKGLLTRCVVQKLFAVLKLHITVPVQNMLHLLQVVLLDAKSRVNAMSLSAQLSANIVVKNRCNAMEYMKSHLHDCLEILGDSKFLFNLDNAIGSKSGQNGVRLNPIEEAYKMKLKLAIAQVVAGQVHLYFASSHQLQSLLQPPSTMQHGQKGQTECMNQIKKLSWILLGALSHLGLQQGACDNLWYPISFSKGPNLASIVQVIITGCLDQTKETNLNLTSLFHAFLFCQLWTVYCEQFSYFTTFEDQIKLTSYNPVGDHRGAGKLLFEFWNRLTPCILLLLQDGKDEQVLTSVHRHIESLMDCLQEYNSSLLNKLAPLWYPMLNINLIQNKNISTDEFALRDPPSPVSVSLEQPENLDCGTDGLVQNGAKVNADHVLTIVERINRNLVNSEKNDLCVIINLRG